MRQILRRLSNRLGFDVVRLNAEPALAPDFPRAFLDLWHQVKPFTMTSPERGYALYEAVRYVTRANVQGTIVECGVWRGGSSMLAALTLRSIAESPRDIYLFDTFSGMTDPSLADMGPDGSSAASLLQAADRDDPIWAIASLDEVRMNIGSIDYPPDNVHFIQGMVEDTIPRRAPEEIAILRLDTDWYESTKHELVHLVPRLAPGGVLIIDDYGHWLGARKAVDEFLEESALSIMLTRIDYTGRLAVMPR